LSHRNATTTTGYIVAAVVLIPFFWLTLGDAYGRFMIAFDPAASMASYYLDPYTSPVTALVCLAAPMVLAYFLKTIMANIVDSSWEISSNAIDWTLVNGKKWSIIAWQKAVQLSRQLKQAYTDKSTTLLGPTGKPAGPIARLMLMSFQALPHLLLVVFLTWCGIAMYLYFSQSRLLYYPEMPSRAVNATPENIGLAYEEVQLLTSDDVRLHGWYVPADNALGTVLFSHGNAGNIGHRLDSVRLFNGLGLNVLLYDYRGFGNSEGKTTEAGTYLDGQAAWDWLALERQIVPGRIVLFGRSLGAAVAADLAIHNPSAAVILESAFTSVPDMAARIYPWLPVRTLSRFQYNNLDKVREITAPLLIVHSPDDEIIPYEQGEQLFEQAREPKQFLKLQGGHNDGFYVSRDHYAESLAEFLQQVLPDPGQELPCEPGG
jgi:fermentation-respiration switch protein FrsA (DUF1100 family)